MSSQDIASQTQNGKAYRQDSATLRALEGLELFKAELSGTNLNVAGTHLSEEEKKKKARIKNEQKHAQSFSNELNELLQSIEQGFKGVEHSFNTMKGISKEINEGLDRARVQAQQLTRIQLAMDSNDKQVMTDMLLDLGCSQSDLDSKSEAFLHDKLQEEYNEGLENYDNLLEFLEHKAEEFKHEVTTTENSIKGLEEQIDAAKQHGQDVGELETKLQSVKDGLSDFKGTMQSQLIKIRSAHTNDFEEASSALESIDTNNTHEEFKSLIHQSRNVDTDVSLTSSFNENASTKLDNDIKELSNSSNTQPIISAPDPWG